MEIKTHPECRNEQCSEGSYSEVVRIEHSGDKFPGSHNASYVSN